MDNALSHISVQEVIWEKAVEESGFNLEINRKPPHSLYLKVMDLWYFKNIQSLQYNTSTRQWRSLLKKWILLFKDLDTITLTNIFIKWKLNILKIIDVEGNNTYIIPHKNRNTLDHICLVINTVFISCIVMDKIKFNNVRNKTQITKWTRTLTTRIMTRFLIRIKRRSRKLFLI